MCPIGATIGAVGALGAAGIGAYASGQASSQQVAAEKQALAVQQQMFNTANTALQPYYSEGTTAGTTLNSLLTPGPNQTAALSQIPGFEFAQDWGQKAVQNLGTTTGLGGNTLTAGANFATGLAQQGLGTIVNPLVQLYGTGENAAGALGQAAGTFSGQESGALTGIGQAQAAGTLGATNAVAGGLTGSANSATNALLLSKLFPGSSGTPTSTSPGIYSTPVNPLATYNQGAVIGGGP